jgi:hypothetical protein
LEFGYRTFWDQPLDLDELILEERHRFFRSLLVLLKEFCVDLNSPAFDGALLSLDISWKCEYA